MTHFIARLKGGNLTFEDRGTIERLKNYALRHEGQRVTITPVVSESPKLRRWYEGAVLPFITYYQEHLDHRNRDDVERVREWIKLEFNGGFVTVEGTAHKVPMSSKGQLPGIVERVMGWAAECGYNTAVLDPERYKEWRDTVFPYGGPDSYIDYCVEIGQLPPKGGIRRVEV